MPTSVTYSITRALRELKTLDARIGDDTNRLVLVDVSVGGKLQRVSNTKEQLAKIAESSFSSVCALINNRDAIKRQIVKSNASTLVTIAGVEYTVAEAIEKKTGIESKKRLCAKMKQEYAIGLQLVEKVRQSNEAKVQELLKGSAEAKADKDKMDAIKGLYPDPEIFDPVNAREGFAELEVEIANFENEVDAALSEINAITKITVALTP